MGNYMPLRSYTLTTPKMNLYWLDKIDDAVSKDFLKSFRSMYKDAFQEYDIIPIDNIASYTQNSQSDKLIIVCRRSICRLEHMLDFFLDGVDESKFSMVLVIIVSISDLEKLPVVPSRNKIGSYQNIDGKQNIKVIDVRYNLPTYKNRVYHFFCIRHRTQTIADKETFPHFLGCSEEKFNSFLEKRRKKGIFVVLVVGFLFSLLLLLVLLQVL